MSLVLSARDSVNGRGQWWWKPLSCRRCCWCLLVLGSGLALLCSLLLGLA